MENLRYSVSLANDRCQARDVVEQMNQYLVGLRYQHNIIVLYGLYAINYTLLLSIPYLASHIIMVNVKMHLFFIVISLSNNVWFALTCCFINLQ